MAGLNGTLSHPVKPVSKLVSGHAAGTGGRNVAPFSQERAITCASGVCPEHQPGIVRNASVARSTVGLHPGGSFGIPLMSYSRARQLTPRDESWRMSPGLPQIVT